MSGGANFPKHLKKLHEIRSAATPQIREELDAMKESISKVLDEEQNKKFQRQFKRFQGFGKGSGQGLAREGKGKTEGLCRAAQNMNDLIFSEKVGVAVICQDQSRGKCLNISKISRYP